MTAVKRKDAEERVPWVKCVKCGQRILFRIRLHTGTQLEYQARRKTFLKVTCAACGHEHAYRAPDVHFEEVRKLPQEVGEWLPPAREQDSSDD